MPISPQYQFLLNLAIAREVLIAEGKVTMPPGAKAQRAEIIAAVERQVKSALNAVSGDLPTAPDSAYKRAWSYLKEVQQLPPSASPNLSAYGHLKRSFSNGSDLAQSASILEWILRTDTPIRDISSARIIDAKAAVEVALHRTLNAPEIPAWLEQAKKESATLDNLDQRNFALMEHQLREAQAVSETLVAQLSEAGSVGQEVWEKTKPTGDFAAWLPHLERTVALVREKGEALGALFDVSPYQALLGGTEHNPGLHNETVNHVFAELRDALPELIQRVTAQQVKESPPLKLPDVAIDAQQHAARALMNALGLDETYSRLDTSAHPFSTGEWDDVRITTRYREDNLLPALMGVVHETGHAIYSRGLPRQWKGQPVGAAQSMWIHESQSLFWENQIASSLPFMEFLSSFLAKEINVSGPEWDAQNLYKLVARVHPGFIRVNADEMTYPAHVILRHDLEQRLIDGSLAPKDLPAAWNAGMKELLGIDVPNNTLGCMQDVHWPGGSFGYFPAYTFGAIAAAQFMEKMRGDIPEVDDLIRSGNFTPIREWLNKNIHHYGAVLDGEALVKQATGKVISARSFLDYLESRYLS